MDPFDKEVTTLLLISCWSRFFLRHTSRALRGLALLPANPQYNISPKAVPAFKRIADCIDASSSSPNPHTSTGPSLTTTNAASPIPIKTEALERILVSIEKFVSQAYDNANYTDIQRANTERALLAHASVPDVLSGVMDRVIKEVLIPHTRFEVARLDVWVGDYQWLGVWGRGWYSGTSSGETDGEKGRQDIGDDDGSSTDLSREGEVWFVDIHKKRRVKLNLNHRKSGLAVREGVNGHGNGQQHQITATKLGNAATTSGFPDDKKNPNHSSTKTNNNKSIKEENTPHQNGSNNKNNDPSPKRAGPEAAIGAAEGRQTTTTTTTGTAMVKVRKCVRCGEMSEDLLPGRGLPTYFRQQVGRCVCEGNFYVDEVI